MLRLVRRRWWVLPLVLAVAVGGVAIWAATPPSPMPEAMAALKSDAQVQVETSPWLIFQPAGRQPDTGLILYPGGRVDQRAYAPTARAIAAGGYLVVTVPMPLNLAVLAPDRAAEVIAAYPAVQHWVVGGHSLGGAMASRFAASHPDAVQGLVLWAAYPDASDDLSRRDLRVVSVYGTRDGLATGAQIEASQRLLPATTLWVAIEGGNHAQFGWYGPQAGDSQASISRSSQQDQTVAATLRLLSDLTGPTE